MYLRYVAPELQDDPDVVETAIRQTYKAFVYVSPSLKSDADWVSEQLSAYKMEEDNYQGRLQDEGWGIQKIPELFRHSKRLCMIGLSNRGQSLEFAPEYLQDDDDLVRTAVRQNGLALEFASQRLRKDPKMVETALRQNGRAIRYADSELLNDAKFRKKMSKKYDSVDSVLREMGY